MKTHKSLLAMLAMVFLIRALIPVGFMPDFSGKHTIQICSGTQIKSIVVNEDGVPASQDHNMDKKHGQYACPYSFLSVALTYFPEHSLDYKAPILVSMESFKVSAQIDTKRFYLSPPSRAPPSPSL
jgi:hypothetical protein